MSEISGQHLMPDGWRTAEEENLYPYPRTTETIAEGVKRSGVMISMTEWDRFQWLENEAVKLKKEVEYLKAVVLRATK